ncbi:MAG: ParB/RepB/Spo0J family partition protein [Desulfomonilia bacterium]|jgi:ParB family chromosome partitioning protein
MAKLSDKNVLEKYSLVGDAVEDIMLEGSTGGAPKTHIVSVGINMIEADPSQPRKTFDQKALKELAESIKSDGLLQPILVRVKPQDDGYLIIAGERRHRASILAGLESVPCIVKDISDEDAFKLSLIENLQREDLNAIEEAEGYKRLKDEFGMTQEEIANTIKKTQSMVAKIMTINRLPEVIKEKYDPGHISRKHLIELAKADHVSDEDKALLVADIYKDKLTVTQLIDKINKMKEQGRGRPKKDPVYVVLRMKTVSYIKSLAKLSAVDPKKIPVDEKVKLKNELNEIVQTATSLIERL